MKKSGLRIIVTGLIAQHPALGGVAWDYLQYPVGLAMLGHDVFYFEDSGEWPYSLDGGPTGKEWVLQDPSSNVAHLANVLSGYGLGDRWAYRFPLHSQWFGLSEQKRREVIETADLLINVSGTLENLNDYAAIPRRAYIDSDPVFTQIKLRMGDETRAFQERFAAHNVHFTFGDRIPENESQTQWRTTTQPVVLSEWNAAAAFREVYTTVMSWTSYKPLSFGGLVYGQKDIEFRRFLGIASRVPGTRLEIAMGGAIHSNWQTPVEPLSDAVAESPPYETALSPHSLLAHSGWQVADSHQACGDLRSYRNYIQSSKGEWSVAKNGYVAGHSGWFSCRSACYLACGRPVIVQDTGFQIPRGDGIVTFSTPDEAVQAILDVEANYARHARAARELAAEYFDAGKVLLRLIDAIG